MAEGALFVPGTLLSAAEIRRLIETAFAPAQLVPHGPPRALGAGPARYWRLGSAARTSRWGSSRP